MSIFKRGKRPNKDSVTSKPCSCGYLSRASKESDSPIQYSSNTDSYEISYQPSPNVFGSLAIYHCLWCGGVASRNDDPEDIFVPLPNAERERLVTLTENIGTTDDAYLKLGVPDHDDPSAEQRIDKATGATTYYRVLIYEKLSDRADIKITDYIEKGLKIGIYPKLKSAEFSPIKQ